jgi:3'-phosphoadenosine 5'-phosphosulfate sulfotransferase (PAPS reductase)/FAD synthetase
MREETPRQIVLAAIKKYNPIKVLLMFSGGHDSLVSTHISARILNSIGMPFSVYHGDTGTGIRQTQDFVKNVCKEFGWDLVIRKPKKKHGYEETVKMLGGYPGPSMHRICYNRLKERPLREFITHQLKSSPYARENVLLLTGLRKSESKIRMGYQDHTRKVNSQIWCNPCFFYSEDDCKDYMRLFSLPQNSVKKQICISGECLCGCFAKPEEAAEISKLYPEAWDRLIRLQKYSPWKWGDRPQDFIKHNPPGQINIFTGKVAYMPMCVGCEEKHKE